MLNFDLMHFTCSCLTECVWHLEDVSQKARSFAEFPQVELKCEILAGNVSQMAMLVGTQTTCCADGGFFHPRQHGEKK